MASLDMNFYPAAGEFPKQYDGDAYAAEHGSWNRADRAGYEVISIPMLNGYADGSYEDFLNRVPPQKRPGVGPSRGRRHR